ncbi:hypothetical protein ACFWIA_08415 [Streptomyces sp. NPDC127068]|uniref:hypothetical protein n=1 Tax=Streptomyces sp. NPDC127068 TaxID=3347127 RepID=UPI003657F82B
MSMKNFDRLLGTWNVTGGAEGTVTYRWLPGEQFLVQDIDLTQYGQAVTGIEVIGRLKPFGAEEPSEHVHSRYYDSAGNTFDYLYEIEDDTLVIWAGEKGSPAHYRGTFNAGGDTVSGAWTYPGGGGYASTMTRTAG